ncbi:hypothetical protein HNR23_005041 [Nocardiopsis mwathae]|uniref:Ribosomal protein L7/L12 C-terminal domain-containing protein n=1 Tax=Nocardiopsis mwathae TaxID=1472723 RepID=A0A7X0D8P9_9ACTN|nr:hypothetical protein [Nocardiopsis mwathae]MBB6174981.1 hypothetical protein [Nocardiopsis mwathae]
MSFALMIAALLAAVAVLGMGAFLLGRLAPGGREAACEPGRPAVPRPRPPVGGYTLVDGADEAAALERARELLALGREAEAVRVLRDAAGLDDRQAHDTVARLRGLGRP